MIKQLIAGAASLALTLGSVALAAAPAQALTGAPCDDGDAWSWSIAMPGPSAAGMAKDCAKLDELGQEVVNLPNWDEVLLTYIFRWGVQTGCWEDA
jgi:hypothetical protein